LAEKVLRHLNGVDNYAVGTHARKLTGHSSVSTIVAIVFKAFMADRAGSKKTVTIEGGSHAVMMSHADAVVELVEQAAAAVG
jgi:hypothetical protein